MAFSHKKYLVDFYYLLISEFIMALHRHDNKLPLRTKSHIGKNKIHRQQKGQPVQKDMQGDGSAVKSSSWTSCVLFWPLWAPNTHTVFICT